MEQREHGKTYIITPLNGRVFMIIDGEQKEDVIHNLSGKHCKPLTEEDASLRERMPSSLL